MSTDFTCNVNKAVVDSIFRPNVQLMVEQNLVGMNACWSAAVGN